MVVRCHSGKERYDAVSEINVFGSLLPFYQNNYITRNKNIKNVTTIAHDPPRGNVVVSSLTNSECLRASTTSNTEDATTEATASDKY